MLAGQLYRLKPFKCYDLLSTIAVLLDIGKKIKRVVLKQNRSKNLDATVMAVGQRCSIVAKPESLI
jgi:hypothetical protein